MKKNTDIKIKYRYIYGFLFLLFVLTTSMSLFKEEPNIIVEGSEKKTKKYQSSDYPKTITPTQNKNGIEVFSGTGRYSIQTIGGANSEGFDSGSNRALNINEESNGDIDIFNSTSMFYEPRGKLIKAYLYFYEGASSSFSPTIDEIIKNGRKTTFLEGPKGDSFHINTGHERAAYDITEFVQNQGQGKYSAKNIDFAYTGGISGDYYGQWNILFLEENEVLPLRTSKIVLYDYILSHSSTVEFKVSGKDFPAKSKGDITASITITGAGGNKTRTGDTVSIKPYTNGIPGNSTLLTDNQRPPSNFFNASITQNDLDMPNRNPARTPANIDIFNKDYRNAAFLQPGLTNLDLKVTTVGDMFALNFVGIAVDIDAPDYITTVYDKPSKLNQVESSKGKKETVYLNFKNDNNNSSIYDSKLNIQLPEFITYEQETIKCNNQIVPTKEVHYNPEKNTLEVDLKMIQPYTDFTIEYDVNIGQGQHKEEITHSLEGKIFYNENEKTTTIYKQKLPSILYYINYQITEQFLDEDTLHPIVPDKNTIYSYLGNETYERKLQLLLNYQPSSYQIDDGTIISIQKGKHVIIDPVIKNTKVTYYYKKTMKLHTRQVILDANQSLITPENGYIFLKNTPNEMNEKILSQVIPTVSDVEQSFQRIELEIQPEQWRVQVVPVVPQYYKYAGHVLTSIDETSHDKTKLETTLPEIDFDKNVEYYLSIYLIPTTTHPIFYTQDYEKQSHD